MYEIAAHMLWGGTRADCCILGLDQVALCQALLTCSSGLGRLPLVGISRCMNPIDAYL